MNMINFLKLVEIQTKAASIIPYILGTAYALYKFDTFNVKQGILLFLGMLIFDMTTTAINNYIDYKKAIKKEGYGYEKHNAIVRYNLNPKTVLVTIIIMLITAIVLGISLVVTTDLVVLLIGMLCFAIGILYSFGPIPISRTPFGEIFSGLTMGLLITFLSIYIHIFNQGIIAININNDMLSLSINIRVIISIIIISMPAITGIANIMLANNICDIEEDIENKRYTLAVYIGKNNALNIFKFIYFGGFISIIIGVCLKVLPLVSIVALITFRPISNNIKKFFKIQSKKDTFILSVKNFVLVNIVYISTIVVGYIINLI